MKTILFLAFMAFTVVACDTPETTTGNTDTDNTTVRSDTAATTTTPGTDTTMRRSPSDTTNNPTDTSRF